LLLEGSTSAADYLPSLELVIGKTDAKIERLPYREGIDDPPEEGN